MTKNEIHFKPMSNSDFSAVIKLATEVHGEGYIDNIKIKQWFDKGVTQNINANYVAYYNDLLVGFRLTFAANCWEPDEWCTPDQWKINPKHVCYFKCNTVDENYRNYGIGSKLLALSIESAKKQGARAGVSHLWKQSPNNSAVNYFTRCGGRLVKEHPNRWFELSKNGYECPICGFTCRCEAAEMIIRFE